MTHQHDDKYKINTITDNNIIDTQELRCHHANQIQ